MANESISNRSSLLRLSRAAAELDTPVETLRYWIKSGRLSPIRLGKNVYLPRSVVEQNLEGIMAWIYRAKLPNVSEPVELDISRCDEFAGNYDAVFSANTAHIMSITLVEAMFGLVAKILRNNGIFCLYGPFNLGPPSSRSDPTSPVAAPAGRRSRDAPFPRA